MRISIVTLGCRTNQAESLKMERELRAAGHEVVPLSASPDFCILNTCSVTSKADADSRRTIDHVVKRSIRSVVTGCFAELYRGEIERSSLSGTVELVTNDHKNTITRMIPQHSGPRQSLSTEGFRTRPIIKVIAAGRTVEVPLRRSMPVYLLYATASVDPDGSVQFREDVYDRDAAPLEALARPLVPR